MKRLLMNVMASIQKFTQKGVVTGRQRGIHLTLESLEERSLLAATPLAPFALPVIPGLDLHNQPQSLMRIVAGPTPQEQPIDYGRNPGDHPGGPTGQAPVTDMTALARQLGVHHNGPTVLYLNFDGGDISAYSNQSSWLIYPQEHIHPFETEAGDAAKNRDQDIQTILFQTAEMFAPFNVQVKRLVGSGRYDDSDNGNTTVFVGADEGNVTDGSEKYTLSKAPTPSVDNPTGTLTGHNHRPNSDGFDLAFVDPVSGAKDVRSWATTEDITTISQTIAHEAGHTFGLTHVRTDGRADPLSLGLGDPNSPDVMSYSPTATFYFNDTTFPITAYLD